MNSDQQNNNRGKGGGNKRNVTAVVSILLWALVLTVLVNYATSLFRQANSVELSYGVFRELIRQDCVDGVLMDSHKYTIYLKDGVSVDAEGNITKTAAAAGITDGSESGDTLETVPPPSEWNASGNQQMAPPPSEWDEEKTTYYCAPLTSDIPELIKLFDEHNVVKFGPEYVEELNPIISLLISWVLPMVVMVLLFSFLFRNMAGKMGGGLGNLGKSNAKVYVEKKTGVTFKDVAGQDEAKESLVEIIDFLHNPQKYTEIGAKLPKGALLVGPPGTGKTLLAKAVAGEANVPFFSISGSDFVEMFVGMGAARVRDLFKEASKMAPCIVFIDEIDTIGKSRDSRMGGNDEREQTLNQLLAEMDGFDPTKGVILLAATNRPEVLDQALLRPGRFDRQITVDRPNLAGRLATLQVHTRNIRLAEDVDLKKVALATAGAVGADLANLVNEAALRAVRLGRKAVNQQDLLTAFELVIAGAEKKGSVLSEFEKKLVAYHEVGHAMVAYKQKHAEPVSKITIVPHTQGALGYTLHLPEEDKHLHTKDELLAQIAVSMGGRVAEELVMHTMTNGAAQDIQDATSIARNMVAMFGMSDQFGMMALASRRNQYLDGGYGLDCADDTAATMDRAVRDIIDVCYKKATEILSESREDMDKVVAYLLEKETITGAEMVAILEGRDPALADQYAELEKREQGANQSVDTAEKVIPLSDGQDSSAAPQEEQPDSDHTEQT
nr:ATP-dependent zinc metalloprotease FtsH [uncultured Flavonifractor sp.]